MCPIEIVNRRRCPDILLSRVAYDGPPVEGLPPGTALCSLPRRVIHHSPAGIEWGYQGSGPADLALLILDYCLPPGCDGQEPVRLWQGQCSQVAWDLHQDLKRTVIQHVLGDGILMLGRWIDEWIDCQVAAWCARQDHSADWPEERVGLA